MKVDVLHGSGGLEGLMDEVRRLRKENKQLNNENTKLASEWHRHLSEMGKLRKVVEAARQVRCAYPPSIRLLEQALRDLEE